MKENKNRTMEEKKQVVKLKNPNGFDNFEVQHVLTNNTYVGTMSSWSSGFDSKPLKLSPKDKNWYKKQQ